MNPDNINKLSETAQVKLMLFIIDQQRRQKRTKKISPRFPKQGLISVSYSIT